MCGSRKGNEGKMKVFQENNKLVIANGMQQVWIEAWGKNSLRVRMTCEAKMDDNDWALTEKVEECVPEITVNELDITDPWYKGDEWKKYHMTGKEYTLKNGKISAKVNPEGWISFYNQKGELLTEEYWRTRDRINRFAVPLRIVA